ncbi:MAG: XRE family transcriptional regulator, partial [Enterococcus hulanensis]
RSQVSEMAETGFDLGSGGSGSLGARGVLRVINFFEEDSKTENLKQDIAQLYTIKFIDEAAAKLRLKQLDY